MATRFDQIMNACASPAHDYLFAVAVTIAKGAETTDEFQASFNDQSHKARSLQSGQTIETVYREWYVPISELTIDDVAFIPSKGMIVQETDGDDFEIMPIAGKPAVEKMPGDYHYMVRTKRIT